MASLFTNYIPFMNKVEQTTFSRHLDYDYKVKTKDFGWGFWWHDENIECLTGEIIFLSARVSMFLCGRRGHLGPSSSSGPVGIKGHNPSIPTQPCVSACHVTVTKFPLDTDGWRETWKIFWLTHAFANPILGRVTSLCLYPFTSEEKYLWWLRWSNLCICILSPQRRSICDGWGGVTSVSVSEEKNLWCHFNI